MATSYEELYSAFLSKVSEEDWSWSEDQAVLEADWKSILESAIPYFKMPRVSLARNETGFVNDISAEIQLLATYMKVEWLERSILSWENIKNQYGETEFSQGNFLNNLNKLMAATQEKADKLQHIYNRNPGGRSYPYGNLAGEI